VNFFLMAIKVFTVKIYQLIILCSPIDYLFYRLKNNVYELYKPFLAHYYYILKKFIKRKFKNYKNNTRIETEFQSEKIKFCLGFIFKPN